MSDRILLSKGQLIHIAGIPFELESDTVVLGCKENLSLFEAIPVTDQAVPVNALLICSPASTKAEADWLNQKRPLSSSQ